MASADNPPDDDRCCHDTARHRELHRCLDELVACWIAEQNSTPPGVLMREGGPVPSKLPSNSTIMELMQWSALKARGEAL
jgi:hypothetical protein